MIKSNPSPRSIIKNVPVHTGNICIIEGDLGKHLEFLSLGDYGKEKNVKADFMGLRKEIEGVPHGALLPLEKKWVVTISSQYGCSMGCKFCDVPKVGPGINATANDMIAQVLTAVRLHPEVRHTERLNLHFARMGEPAHNPDVFIAASYLKGYFDRIGWGFHPVVSTICPKNADWEYYLEEWMKLKATIFEGNAGLQISVNTTNPTIRRETMRQASNLSQIAPHLNYLGEKYLKGRKIALNFAIADNAPISGKELREMFNPQYMMCKLTPMHLTNACKGNNLLTTGGYDYYYPYKEIEEDLKAHGFDVLVFVPSKEEDESQITCGNAILADRESKNRS